MGEEDQPTSNAQILKAVADTVLQYCKLAGVLATALGFFTIFARCVQLNFFPSISIESATSAFLAVATLTSVMFVVILSGIATPAMFLSTFLGKHRRSVSDAKNPQSHTQAHLIFITLLSCIFASAAVFLAATLYLTHYLPPDYSAELSIASALTFAISLFGAVWFIGRSTGRTKPMPEKTAQRFRRRTGRALHFNKYFRLIKKDIYSVFTITVSFGLVAFFFSISICLLIFESEKSAVMQTIVIAAIAGFTVAMSIALYATQDRPIIFSVIGGNIAIALVALLAIPSLSGGIVRALGIGSLFHQTITVDRLGADILRSAGIPVYPASNESTYWNSTRIDVLLQLGEKTLLETTSDWTNNRIKLTIPSKSILAMATINRRSYQNQIFFADEKQVKANQMLAYFRASFFPSNGYEMNREVSTKAIFVVQQAANSSTLDAARNITALSEFLGSTSHVKVITQTYSPGTPFVTSRLAQLVDSSIASNEQTIVVFIGFTSPLNSADAGFHAKGPLSQEIRSIFEFSARSVGMSLLESKAHISPIRKELSERFNFQEHVTVCELDINLRWIGSHDLAGNDVFSKAVSFLMTFASSVNTLE